MIAINENKLIELINYALRKNDVEEIYDEMVDDYHSNLINENILELSSEDLEKLKIAIESYFK